MWAGAECGFGGMQDPGLGAGRDVVKVRRG